MKKTRRKVPVKKNGPKDMPSLMAGRKSAFEAPAASKTGQARPANSRKKNEPGHPRPPLFRIRNWKGQQDWPAAQELKKRQTEPEPGSPEETGNPENQS